MNINVPSLKILKEVPPYLKFLTGLLFEKSEPENVLVVVIGEVCNVALQRMSLSKLRDPSSFSIPCSVGNMPIGRALYDLGVSVNLMPLSLSLSLSLSMCKKLKLLDLKSTTTQFTDCSIKLPVGILEDIPVQVGKFLIPSDLIVLDMDEDLSLIHI